MNRLNELLDTLPRARLGAYGREVPAFLTCGITGFYLALIVLFAGGLMAGQSLLVLAALALVSALSFFVYTYLRMWITGRETLVLLEHVWFALACDALALRWMGEPVLPYLDTVSVALCPFLAMGRIGCTLVGCCHGQPSSFGITYNEGCVRDELEKHLVGVRLFPVPAIEAIGLLTIGATGLIALPVAHAGRVFAWYLLAYSVMRFGLEGIRGDWRPQFLGLSQARWMSIVEAGFALRLLPGEHAVPSAVVYGALVTALLAALTVRGVTDWRRRLLTPSHVRELRELVRGQIEPAGRVPFPEPKLRKTSRQVVAAVSPAGTTPSAAHLSLSLLDDHGDLLTLCRVAVHAFPELLPHTAQFTERLILHVLVPLPLLDEGVDVRTVEDRFRLLYGSIVRRLQRGEQATSARTLAVSSVSAWQRFLDALERDAASAHPRAELIRSAPSESTAVGLLIDPAGEGHEIHSYSLRGESGPLDESTAITVAGMIAQRLPLHRILRAGFCKAGAFHLWAIVDPSAPPGSTIADEPSIVWRRAQTYAERLRSASSSENVLSAVGPPLPAPQDSDARTAPQSAAWYFRQTG